MDIYHVRMGILSSIAVQIHLFLTQRVFYPRGRRHCYRGPLTTSAMRITGRLQGTPTAKKKDGGMAPVSFMKAS
jgi:hypothetical protein